MRTNNCFRPSSVPSFDLKFLKNFVHLSLSTIFLLVCPQEVCFDSTRSIFLVFLFLHFLFTFGRSCIVTGSPKSSSSSSLLPLISRICDEEPGVHTPSLWEGDLEDPPSTLSILLLLPLGRLRRLPFPDSSLPK